MLCALFIKMYTSGESIILTLTNLCVLTELLNLMQKPYSLIQLILSEKTLIMFCF